MEYVKSETKHVKTAYAALSLSSISIISAVLSVFPIPIVLSPIAMILSHISKGRLKAKHFAAQAATVLAILAFILNIIICGWQYYRLQNDPKVKQELNGYTHELYGMDYDEYVNTLTETIRTTLSGQQ